MRPEEESMKRLMIRVIVSSLACLVIGGCAESNVTALSTSKGQASVVSGSQLQREGQGGHQFEPIKTESLSESSADEVVKRLAELGPDGLPGMARAALSPREQLRRNLYRRLRELGEGAVPALILGLEDPDVLVRRNVVLFLAAGQGYYSEFRELTYVRMPSLSLARALDDSDSIVRAWAAQAIGLNGPGAVEAVPALVALLSREDEASRNSACIALRGIGPAAKAALPALRRAALSDPSADVRGFANRAIDAIEAQPPPKP
jgi:hypothetical protein